MFSDDWLKSGYVHGENIRIVDSLIQYKIWHDSNNSPIGVTVDFEYAVEVFIFDILYNDWCKFLREELWIIYNMDCNILLQLYFAVENDLLLF
jgi:hypothetical protein